MMNAITKAEKEKKRTKLLLCIPFPWSYFATFIKKIKICIPYFKNININFTNYIFKSKDLFRYKGILPHAC